MQDLHLSTSWVILMSRINRIQRLGRLWLYGPFLSKRPKDFYYVFRKLQQRQEICN